MSVFTWLFDRFKEKQNKKFIAKAGAIQEKKFENILYKINDTSIGIEQFQNWLWYNSDPDMLMWFYTKGIFIEGVTMIAMDGWRNNFTNYFWKKAAEEKNVKRTHSGLPKVMIDTIVRCISEYKLSVTKDKEKDIVRNKLLEDILLDNNFKATNKKQLTMDLVVGDGAYIITIDKTKSDYPLIEYYNGMDCAFEFTGDKVTAVTICKRYEKKDRTYECYEKRSTIREYNEKANKYETKATIEYKLVERDTKNGYTERPLEELEETKGLQNMKYDIPFMLAVPCIKTIDVISKRGVSAFKGKIDLFDDFDQNISQEANIMRAITPVEYIDSNLLDHDKNGDLIMPSAFGKQYVLYKGASDYNQAPNKVESVFYQIDFSKLTVESQETMMRCMCGFISPATMGYGVSADASGASVREKEKVTKETVDDLQKYESEILSKLFKLVLYCYDKMKNKKAIFKDDNVNVNYTPYGSMANEEKLTYYGKALKDGYVSLDKFIDEVYCVADTETKEKEKKALKEQMQNETPTFNLES